MEDRNSYHADTYNTVINAIFLKQRAVAMMGDGVVITDPMQPDNPIIYCNMAFELLTGYTAPQVFGRNCRFLQGKKTDKEKQQEIRDSLANNQLFSGEILNYRKDGSPFWNHLTISPIFNDNGELCNFVGIQRDVTHIVNMRIELAKEKKVNKAYKIASQKLLDRVQEQEGALKSHLSKKQK